MSKLKVALDTIWRRFGTCDGKEILIYLDAYVKFRRETSFEPKEIELPLYHPKYFYAGTIDRIGKLNGSQDLICSLSCRVPNRPLTGVHRPLPYLQFLDIESPE
jgi:hypothetical protein